MYLKSIRLQKTGPIENLSFELPFDGERPKPVVLVGPNGSGKSTVLSFIVNTLVAVKQNVFEDGTDHQIGANTDHLERATGLVIDPGVSF